MEPIAAASAALHNNECAGETQGATQQASQYASYYPGVVHPMESPFFGCLQPCHTALRRIDFQKSRPHNSVGRGPGNDFTLPGMRISALFSLSHPLVPFGRGGDVSFSFFFFFGVAQWGVFFLLCCLYRLSSLPDHMGWERRSAVAGRRARQLVEWNLGA
jgi:hypothetical protein